MRRISTIPFAICLVSVLLLFPGASLLLAQEQVRPVPPQELPAVPGVERQNQTEQLLKQEENFKKQIEDLRLQLQELGKQKQKAVKEQTGAAARAMSETRRVIQQQRNAIESLRATNSARDQFSAQLSGLYRLTSRPSFAERGIELRRQELERVMKSHGDKGLVALLRFEKARVCRKAKMYDEAIQELQKIIDENLADETTNAARWTLVEILQEQKKNEEAIAELEKIFISASDIQDRMDATYGIINLSGEGPKAKIQAIDRLIQALLRDQANLAGCTSNLEQLYAAERKYAADHHGYLSEKLSDLYPDYVDNLNVFTCPAAKGPKITRKEDIDSLTSYDLVAKGQPLEAPVGEAANIFPVGGRSQKKLWIREKTQNHGRRYFAVYNDGLTGWIGAR